MEWVEVVTPTLLIVGVYLIWVIARAVEKIERHLEAMRHLLRHALYGDSTDYSEVSRIRSTAERFLQWEAEKRPRL